MKLLASNKGRDKKYIIKSVVIPDTERNNWASSQTFPKINNNKNNYFEA